MLIDEIMKEDINRYSRPMYNDEDYGFFCDFTDELNSYEYKKEIKQRKVKVFEEDDDPRKDPSAPLFNKILMTLTLSFALFVIYKTV